MVVDGDGGPADGRRADLSFWESLDELPFGFSSNNFP